MLGVLWIRAGLLAVYNYFQCWLLYLYMSKNYGLLWRKLRVYDIAFLKYLVMFFFLNSNNYETFKRIFFEPDLIKIFLLRKKNIPFLYLCDVFYAQWRFTRDETAELEMLRTEFETLKANETKIEPVIFREQENKLSVTIRRLEKLEFSDYCVLSFAQNYRLVRSCFGHERAKGQQFDICWKLHELTTEFRFQLCNFPAYLNENVVVTSLSKNVVQNIFPKLLLQFMCYSQDALVFKQLKPVDLFGFFRVWSWRARNLSLAERVDFAADRVENTVFHPYKYNSRLSYPRYLYLLLGYQSYFQSLGIKDCFKNVSNFIRNFNNFFFTFFKMSQFVLMFRHVYPTRYRPTDNSKDKSIHKIDVAGFILFLRKIRVFNKGRYSRNRQLYRTGVYWCIWLNVLVVVGLYYYFYKFTFNFGYIFWIFFIFLLSLCSSRIIKYRFYNYKIIVKELTHFEHLVIKMYKHIQHNVIPDFKFATKVFRRFNYAVIVAFGKVLKKKLVQFKFFFWSIKRK